MDNFTKLSEWVSWYKTVQKQPDFDSVIHPRLFWKTDDSVSISLFQKDQFQVELYLIDNLSKVPEHSHPGVDVFQETLTKRGVWETSQILKPPKTHGGVGDLGPTVEGVIVTYELWDPGITPTSLSVRWLGKTVGPLQEALIKQVYPTAVIERGWVLSL